MSVRTLHFWRWIAWVLALMLLFNSGSNAYQAASVSEKPAAVQAFLPDEELGELTDVVGEIAVAAVTKRAAVLKQQPTESDWSITAYYVNEDDQHHVEKTDNFSLKYQVEMQIDRYIPPFGLRIIIPAGLMVRRDNNGHESGSGPYPVMANDIAVPMGTPDAPVASKTLCFNYYIDDDGNYVFFNYDTVQTGTNAAFQVLYKNLDIMELVDNSSWNLQGYAVLGEETKQLPALTGHIDTHVQLGNVQKLPKHIPDKNYGPELYTRNQVAAYAKYCLVHELTGEWLDFSHYGYLAWEVNVNASANQPYHIRLSDTLNVPGAQIVGFSHAVTPLGNGEYELVHDAKERTYSDKVTIVVRYPFSQIRNADSTYRTIDNAVAVALEPADHQDPVQTKTDTASYVYEDYVWEYHGKGSHLSKTSAGEYYSWLDVYKLSAAGSSARAAEFPFTVRSTVSDYDYTHIIHDMYHLGELIPDRSYTVTTEDCNLYAYYNGLNTQETRSVLSKEDYYFSSVRVKIHDTGYDPYEDETAAPTNTVHCNSKIYAVFADSEGWEPVAEVPYATAVYEFSAEQLRREPYRVKVERETVNYKTECEMALTVRIRDTSPVFQSYVQHLTTDGGVVEQVTVVNQADMFYQENGGARLGEAYKDGQAVLYPLTPHAQALKTGTAVNDPQSGCVRLRYNLMEADGYYVYDHNDIAVLSGSNAVVAPGRHRVVFYDLLPYGIQFDPSQEIHAGRLTNLDMENTYYKDLNANQVTVTVDPQDIQYNYRGTGRTLVAFHLELEPDAQWLDLIQDRYRTMWCEGWGVSFGAYYSWVDEKIAGSTTNIACFLPEEPSLKNVPLIGEASTVLPDNGSAPEMYRLFGSDINHDGVQEVRSVIYMNGSVTSLVAQASESEIVKEVRADYDKFGEFSRTATVPLGEGYTYRIQIKTVQTPLTDIVIYDYFETARDRDAPQEQINDQFIFTSDTNYWYGRFDYIIDGTLRTKMTQYGLEPVYYYYVGGFAGGQQLPRQPREEVLIHRTTEEGADVTNPAILLTEENGWYRKEVIEQQYPNAVIYGIAADLGEFRLEPNDSVEIQIHMTSPAVNVNQDGLTSYPYCHINQPAEFTYNDAKYFARQILNDASQHPTIITSLPTVVSQMLPSSVEVGKQIVGNVPAGAVNTRFGFHARIHRRGDFLIRPLGVNESTEGKTIVTENGIQYVITENYMDFSHQEYQLYQYNSATGQYDAYPNIFATDENGNFYLSHGQMAKFMNIDAGSSFVVEETENPFWKCTQTETNFYEVSPPVKRYMFQNEYRPVLYFTKSTMSVPEDAPEEALEQSFRFCLTAGGMPVANQEYWIVGNKPLDGRGTSPILIEKRCTDSNGIFTLKAGQTAALLPGDADVSYKVKELFDDDIRKYWLAYDEDNVTGQLELNGSSQEMKNIYRLKKLFLTKRVSHSIIHDPDLAFKFKIFFAESEVPLTGIEWKKSDESAWRVLDSDHPYITLRANETAVIRNLEAQRTYNIKEYLDGAEYENYKSISGDLDNILTVGMPKQEISTSVEYVNDYILRDIVVKKRVAYDAESMTPEEMEALNSKEFRMFVEVQTAPDSEVYQRYIGSFLRTDGTNTTTENTDAQGNFSIRRGEVVTFRDIVKEGLQYRVYEYKDADYIQISPVAEECDVGEPQTPFTGVAGKTDCQVEFTNGKKGIFIIGKEYISYDAIGQAYIDRLIKKSSRQKNAVALTLELLCENGEWKTFPTVDGKEVTVVDTLHPNEPLQTVSWERGQPIRIEPWKQIVIKRSDVQETTWTGVYRLSESENDRYKLYDSSSIENGTYVAVTAEHDTITSDIEVKPVTVIKNIVEGITPQSVVCKKMLGGSEEVPSNSLLKMQVQEYKNGSWMPAKDIPYFTGDYDARQCEDYPVTSLHKDHINDSRIRTTDANGVIELVKEGDSDGVSRKYLMPKIVFPQHDVEARIDHPSEGSLRIVELLEQDTDHNWGQFVGTASEANVSFIINSKRPAYIEVEKLVTGEEENHSEFSFQLRQLTDLSGDMTVLTDSQIASSVVAKNIVYHVFEPDEDDPSHYHHVKKDDPNDPDHGFNTGLNGIFTLKKSQFARFEVEEGTVWLVSELAGSSASSQGIYSLSSLEVEGTGSVPRTNLAVLRTTAATVIDYMVIASEKLYVGEGDDEPFYPSDITVITTDSAGQQTVETEFTIDSFVYTDSRGVNHTVAPQNGAYQIPSQADSGSVTITVSCKGMTDSITLPVAKLATITSKTDAGHATGVQYNIPGIGKTLFLNYMTDDYYTLDGHHLEWTGQHLAQSSKPEMDIVIPDIMVDESGRYFAVKAIGDNAFKGVGFHGTLTLPDRLIKIGDKSFEGNHFTEGLYLSDHIREIGTFAFHDAGFETSLHITENPGFTKLPSSVFRECGFKGDLVIPDNITVIGERAFQNVHFDGNLILPPSLTRIENVAFYGNEFVGDLYIPNSVTYIGHVSFCHAGFTGTLHLPENPAYTEILGMGPYSEGVFHDCGFKTISLPDNIRIIGKRAFNRNYSLKGTDNNQLVIPEQITEIRFTSFGLCTSLTDLVIKSPNVVFDPDSKDEFGLCTSLRYIEVPNTVQFGSHTFDGTPLNDSTLKIWIADGSRGLSQSFAGSFTKLIIGEGDGEEKNHTLAITGSVVSRQSTLTEIRIGRGVRSIAEGTFNGLDARKNVHVYLDTSFRNDTEILRAFPSFVTISYTEIP